MQYAQLGDRVTVHYTGKMDDGVFETSLDKPALEFEIGKGQVIKGFEHAVIGMKPGSWKTVEIPAQEGFGTRRKDLIVRTDRSKLHAFGSLQKGMNVDIQVDPSKSMKARVVAIEGDEVVLDGNHPLAGCELTFDTHLVGIQWQSSLLTGTMQPN